MKKTYNSEPGGDDLLREYDFRQLRVVARGPGRKSPETTVRLAPDVAEAFSSSEAVNNALRFLRRTYPPVELPPSGAAGDFLQGDRLPAKRERLQLARERATLLLRQAWLEEAVIPQSLTSPLGIIEPVLLAEKLLHVEFLEPEVPPEGSEIAGYIDREKNTIAVARRVGNLRLPLEVRRFTAAHEVGHWLLHPGTVYFRDMALSGPGQERNRPFEELEADHFAAEFLMPEKILREEFRKRHGTMSLAAGPIDEHLALRLSYGTDFKGTAADLLQGGRRFRSKLVAQCLPPDVQEPYQSLARLFRVSLTAMAIQLEELGLV